MAAHSHQTAFPVVDSGGELTRLGLQRRAHPYPPEDRSLLRIERAAIAVPATYQAAPGDPAGPLLARPPVGGEVAAVVLDQGGYPAW
jgi:hypothetical protein